jgi:predicted metal-dependent hydrolase
MDYSDEFLIGVQLFNRGDYFESHEVWESIWKQTVGPDREFFQGLIQVAVAICHLCNGNAPGARRLYHRALAHLAPFYPKHSGVNLERFETSLARCFARVLAAEPDITATNVAETALRIDLDPSPARWPEVPATDITD